MHYAMLWHEAYGADGTEDADPLPKMIGNEDPSLLGPYVPTELGTVEDVRLKLSQACGINPHSHNICDRTACVLG